LLLVVAILATFAAYAVAGCNANADRGDMTITAQARYRLDMDGTNFTPNTNAQWTQMMRTRFGIKACASDKAGVFAQFQDSRLLGQNAGTFMYNNNVMEETGVHQAYLWYKPCPKGWIKAGRMSAKMHNQRLIGTDDWSNFGRTEEGIMLGRELSEKVNFTGAAWQLQENNAVDVNGDNIVDPMFYAFDLNFSEIQADVFAYYMKNAAMANYKLWTFGAYSNRTFATTWYYDAMVAFQSGSDDNIDYSGTLINATIGDTFASGFKAAALVDYTTGDDPTTANKSEAFNNLLYSPHMFNGYMDYFAPGGMLASGNGLMDLGLKVAYPFGDGWCAAATGHHFATDQDYDANGHTALGTEFDLSLRNTDGPFSIEGGLGIFSPSSDYMANTDTGTWGYIQGTVNY
jgi:hypothetical protein